MRKVHIDGQVWEYYIGRQHVVIVAPDGKKSIPNFSELTGWSWAVIECGEDKLYFSITPSMIKKWIIENVIRT